MTATVEFQPNDAFYICCVGQSVTFDSAWRTYCLVDRICFHDQCDDPTFAPHRLKMAHAVQRAITAGLVTVADNHISLCQDLSLRFDALRESGLNEIAAADEIDTFLQTQSWDAVSDGQLPP